MQLLAQLGEDILATLPQAMKFQVIAYGNQTWNDSASGLSSVAGAYLLAGPPLSGRSKRSYKRRDSSMDYSKTCRHWQERTNSHCVENY